MARVHPMRPTCVRRLASVLAVLSAALSPAADVSRTVAPDPAALPAPRRVIVPKLQGELTLDGEFKEPVWAGAVVLGPFVPAGGLGAARESTVVRMWYDDTALYLGWTCLDTDIQATFTARDSKFWEEEVVEFFVTRGELTRYYELQWNPLGGEFDAIITNTLDERGVSRKFEGDWSYTAKGMRSAVKVRGTVQKSDDRDESWQVEVSIPFADLGGPAPKPGEVWRANFYRFNRGTGHPVEMLSWSAPILNGFHQPARFGFLEFGR
jgi:hypothetical protein